MIAILSDIHGNFEALKAVMKEIDNMSVQEIYCLGDVVGYYPQINECCELLQERKIKTIMGNHDWYMAAKSFCPRSRSVNDCLKYQHEIITPQNYKWICSLPVYLSEHGISFVHGSWSNPIDDYFEPSEEYLERLSGKFFVSGHTHKPLIFNGKNKKYCNPGSVGQPRDWDNRASFATFDGIDFCIHRVEYDFSVVGKLMDQAGFNGYYYGCLKNGSPKLTW